jgi:DNA (cytosine-5)-methyltransferase 1
VARKTNGTIGTVVDLFCGGGGFSLGAELAGFRSLAAIDIDPALQSAYRLNFPRARAIQASVADIDRSAWRQFIGKTRPDGLIGGPPCQGFSRIGKRQKDDPRNDLIHHFFKHVETLRPKFFVMESVEGLLDEDRVVILRNALEGLAHQYQLLAPFAVNAAHFGAATRRHRVVVIGYDPNDVDPISVEMLRLGPPKNIVTVREAISDLPTPVSDLNAEESFGWAKYPRRSPSRLSGYARKLRRAPIAGLGWSKAIAMLKEGYISGLASTRHSKLIAKRYERTVGGKSDPITKSYRLEWDGQCPTLRAGTGSDKGSFQAVRPLHPGTGRVITVREAARLQGFPDWFVFHPTKWHSFRMIGNSVSPLVSYGLLAKISPRLQSVCLD